MFHQHFQICTPPTQDFITKSHGFNSNFGWPYLGRMRAAQWIQFSIAGFRLKEMYLSWRALFKSVELPTTLSFLFVHSYADNLSFPWK